MLVILLRRYFLPPYSVKEDEPIQKSSQIKTSCSLAGENLTF